MGIFVTPAEVGKPVGVTVGKTVDGFKAGKDVLGKLVGETEGI